jgi:predicted HTH domain antitoxin
MPIVIPDEVLQQAGLSEREALIEIACRLFEAGKLQLPDASKLTSLTRTEMEAELLKRKIPIYRPTAEELMSDLETLKRAGF